MTWATTIDPRRFYDDRCRWLPAGAGFSCAKQVHLVPERLAPPLRIASSARTIGGTVTDKLVHHRPRYHIGQYAATKRATQSP